MHISVLHKIHMLCVTLISCHSITLYYSLSQLTQLEILDIGRNPLNTVPDVVSSLTSLKQLDMWNCGISSLPERFVSHVYYYFTTLLLLLCNLYLYTTYIVYKIIYRIQSVVILPVLNLTVLCYTISLEVTSQKALKNLTY